MAPQGVAGAAEVASTTSTFERPFIALALSANAEHRLPPLPGHLAGDLGAAETELCGDGTAIVVAASPWRWGGPRAGEIVGWLTLRRWGPDGEIWDLLCGVTIDPEQHGPGHVDLVVRWTSEARLDHDLPAVGQWWACRDVLRPVERDAIAAASLEAAGDPPPRLVAPAGVGRVPLRLDAGSLGSIEGELRIAADLGLAYVRAASGSALEARALRAAVDDGRLAVPHWIRAWLDNDGALLALEGTGAL